MTLPGAGGTVTFKYDPFGRRIQKSAGLAVTNYAYDGDNPIEELNATGAVTAQYTQGLGIDEPLAMYRNGGSFFYHADGLGSIAALTDTTGSPAAAYVYDSFGNTFQVPGSVTNPFRYTAREFDIETSLYYYRARYYEPAIGRFLSEDPARFSGGINFFTYAQDHPTDFVDPSGLEPQQGCKDCRGRPILGLDVAKRCCANEDPLPSSSPNPYSPLDGYAFTNAGLMFTYGGNGRWGQIVRACLICLMRHGATPHEAHKFCYVNAFSRTTRLQGASGLLRALAAAGVIDIAEIVALIDEAQSPANVHLWAIGPLFTSFGGRSSVK